MSENSVENLPERIDVEQFRTEATRAIDWIAAYLSHPEAYPVLSRVRPGEVRKSQPAALPEEGVPFDELMDRFAADIVPGITHWNHPSFFAYFAPSASTTAVLGEMLMAAVNVNAMLWRTSPSATELEELSLAWIRQLLGLPDVFQGHLQDTGSTSTLVALASAREALDLGIREKGLSGRDLPPLRVYCSSETHSSIDKAAVCLGLGLEGVRHLPVTADLGLDAAALRDAIREDREHGVVPMAAVATAGTTSTGAIDPMEEIADVCAEEGVWLHVDAAYGGSAAAVPRIRPLFRGWERADSILVNPHKWMFVGMDCSALLLRDPDVTRRAFSVLPEYLRSLEGEPTTNLMDFGIALGKRFRGLKVWLTLLSFGRRELVARIERHCDLAGDLAVRIDAEPDWEVLAPVHLSLVCFRFAPGLPDEETDALNQRIMERVNERGRTFLSHTRIRGVFAIRLAIGNVRTEARDVAGAWDELRLAADAEMAERAG